MIEAKRYSLNTLFEIDSLPKEAIDFVLNINENTPFGLYIINDRIAINYVSYVAVRKLNKMQFESHSHTVDIHVILSGEENIYIANEDDLERVGDYCESDDYTLFEGQTNNCLLLRKNDVLFIPAHIAHAPGFIFKSAGWVKKAIIKVKQI